MNKARKSFEEFINDEAELLGIDGCTGVTNLRAFCCRVHDLEYRYRVDARSAYKCYREGYQYYWLVADKTKKSDADARFRSCLQKHSPLGYWSPLPYIRWIGVKLFGRWK